MNKGQISLEIIIGVSFVLLIFIFFLIFYLRESNNLKELDKSLKLRDECFKISNAIESTLTLGPGYNIKINSVNNITLLSGTISIRSSDGTDVVCNYRGDVTSGTYTGEINIANINNNIIIQNG